MLIEVPYKDGDVISMKLNTGEEVVAKLVEETTNGVVVNKPFTLIANQQGLGLAPFMFSTSPDSKYTINSKNITCINKTVEDIKNQYIESTTGIKLV